MYPLSTLLLVGLIAFLIGSLLRSLLSPADFMYVVEPAPAAITVGGEGVVTLAQDGGVPVGYVKEDLELAAQQPNAPMKLTTGGWREIRRLLEVKYLMGGWDLQVAVVRRQ